MKVTDQSLVWSDGKSSEFTAWENGTVIENHSGSSCVSVSVTGVWTLEKCSTLLPSFCLHSFIAESVNAVPANEIEEVLTSAASLAQTSESTTAGSLHTAMFATTEGNEITISNESFNTVPANEIQEVFKTAASFAQTSEFKTSESTTAGLLRTATTEGNEITESHSTATITTEDLTLEKPDNITEKNGITKAYDKTEASPTKENVIPKALVDTTTQTGEVNLLSYTINMNVDSTTSESMTCELVSMMSLNMWDSTSV